MKLQSTLLAVLVGAASTMVLAGEGGPKGERGDRAAKMHERLKAADKNSDGKISREEATASLPRVAKNFDAIDADKDGQVTKEELKSFHEKNHPKKDK